MKAQGSLALLAAWLCSDKASCTAGSRLRTGEGTRLVQIFFRTNRNTCSRFSGEQ